MHEIALPDSLFARLQALAIPLVDTPADVVERLLDNHERTRPEKPKVGIEIGATARSKDGSFLRGASITERIPRERGATIEIDGHVIRAISVREMYEEALKFLVDKGHSKRLNDIVPLSTSSLRYLIANRPVHPSGNEFVIPVSYGGYFMEAHKSYKNAIKH
ncbi:MAG: hypothetical protein HZB35_00480 [Nitrospirae bacterium]|nr:hypothetical protein [Nitrospirota bacterium]